MVLNYDFIIHFTFLSLHNGFHYLFGNEHLYYIYNHSEHNDNRIVHRCIASYHFYPFLSPFLYISPAHTGGKPRHPAVTLAQSGLGQTSMGDNRVKRFDSAV